ncbi:MAG: TIM barrel protein [Deltaproteobacteria bacterium]|nr:TIM barrel protein [Deltaproteobacteria bacterium]
MPKPRLAICNFIPDVERLRSTALEHGFSGVDWTFTLEDVPGGKGHKQSLIRRISRLHPLEVRYHCAFKGVDMGDEDPEKADRAVDIFRETCRLVAHLEGRFMTVHLGLGRESCDDLSWERTLSSLADLVAFGRNLGVRVCLENLASGWSSRPELFEKLVRKTNAGVTLDIGHARVSPSIQSRHYAFEDFISPHYEHVHNAHVYHEEIDGSHTAPQSLDEIGERLHLLSCLPCDWWVLELREEEALFSTLQVVREFFDAVPHERPAQYLGMLSS